MRVSISEAVAWVRLVMGEIQGAIDRREETIDGDALGQKFAGVDADVQAAREQPADPEP